MMERGSGSLNAAFAFKLGLFARLRSKRPLSPGVAGGLAKGVMLFCALRLSWRDRARQRGSC